jgi:hypothetical protein
MVAPLVIMFALGPMEVIFLFSFSVIGLIPKIFYLFTLSNTLEKVSPQNRKMKPDCAGKIDMK